MNTNPAEAPRDVVEQLAQRYDTMKKSMRTLDAQAEAAVRRWEWTTGEYYSLRPLYTERFGIARGKILPGDPNKAGDLWLFGFDAQDRLLTRCMYRRYAEPDEADYMLYDEQGIEVIRYVNTHFGTADSYMMHGVGRLRGNVKQPEWYCEVEGNFGNLHVTFERYRYEADRLVEVQLQRRAGLNANDPAHPQTHEISYDAKGRPDVIIDDPYRRAVEAAWTIPSSGKAPEANGVAEIFSEAISRTVRENRDLFKGRYCWLDISYDAVADPGALLVFGLEETRTHFMESTYDRWFVSLMGHSYNPFARMEQMLHMEWPEPVESYIDACRDRQDWQAVRELFAEVGRALNSVDWASLIDVTEDFIVFANDQEDTGDTEEYILECVPENKLDLWRVNGWFS